MVTACHSRTHRKGLACERLWADIRVLPRHLWLPAGLNGWIGVVFAFGASLFALGALFALFPQLAAYWSLSGAQVNGVFFAGSIPFTTAAGMQLMQSARAGSLESAGGGEAGRYKWFGWYPTDAGWLSCALQFAGTLLFNVSTFEALPPELDWLQQDLYVWVPDMLGSILFMASGYLAFVETCHSGWAWKPQLLSWRITFVNLLGCIFFMISAVFAFVGIKSSGFEAVSISLVFTLLGAVGFFSGAILLLPEAAE